MAIFSKKTKNKYKIETNVNKQRLKQDLQQIGYTIKDACIIAMAFDKSEAIKKLKNLSLPITEHLVKLIVMPKSSNVSHWKSELKTWQNILRRYNKGKTKSGINFSMKLLMLHLWENPLSQSSDQNIVLQILSESGYAVPKTLNQKQINSLKKAVVTFATGILN